MDKSEDLSNELRTEFSSILLLELWKIVKSGMDLLNFRN